TDVGSSQEVVVTTSGNTSEAGSSGPGVNIIPREGGNAVKGSFFATGTSGAMQSSNYTQALKDSGLKAPNDLQKVWDTVATLGGPIARDKLWFFLTSRYRGNRQYVAGMYYNKNASNPASWMYEPDLNRRATDDGTWTTASLRLTWQATSVNKF